MTTTMIDARRGSTRGVAAAEGEASTPGITEEGTVHVAPITTVTAIKMAAAGHSATGQEIAAVVE